MITPQDLAELSRSLVGSVTPEVRIRCAISRSYYAAYHFCNLAANNWCNDLSPGEDTNKGAHEKLYARLQNHSKFSALDNDLRLIAQHAKKLRDFRIKADYHLDDTVTQKDHTRGLVWMVEIQKKFEQLSKTAISLK
jgi:hypothetical protein